MQSWINLADQVQSSRFTTIFLDASLKSFLVLAMAGVISLCLRRKSAAMRHAIWLAGLIGCVCLPIFSFILPGWQKPLWTVATQHDSGNELKVAIEFAPAMTSPAATATASRERRDAMLQQESPKPHPSRQMAAHFNKRWVPVALVLWLSGVVVALAPLALGLLRLRGLRSGAELVNEKDWTTLLNNLCDELRLERRVSLLRS